MQIRTWMSVLFTSLFLAFSAPVLAADDETAGLAVNINTASVELLAESLEGIGLSKAAEIVAHREMFGAFIAVDELVEVKGIGESLLERNRARIVLSDE